MADAMTEFNQKVVEEFRANGGKVGGPFAGAPMIVLTHTGAKSGQTHTTPLVYSPAGDRFVIIASKAGAPTNPAWYYNLIAHPEVTIEVGTERYTARAVEARGTERDRLFDAQARLMPQFQRVQEEDDAHDSGLHARTDSLSARHPDRRPPPGNQRKLGRDELGDRHRPWLAAIASHSRDRSISCAPSSFPKP